MTPFWPFTRAFWRLAFCSDFWFIITRVSPVVMFSRVDSRHSTRHTEPKEPLPSWSTYLNNSQDVSTILTFSSSVFLFAFACAFYYYSSYFFICILSESLLFTKCKLPVLCLLFYMFIFFDYSPLAALTPPREMYDTCETCDSLSSLSRALEIRGWTGAIKPPSPSVRFLGFFNLVKLLGGTILVRGDDYLLVSRFLFGPLMTLFESDYGPSWSMTNSFSMWFGFWSNGSCWPRFIVNFC